ncbi:MAG: methyl-accepting chemotaxis protein [Deltaproteobacteria bacterium]|nr:methyl-accepting chemotaxis protein [Deltaproteobacteria bacterium]
MSWKNWSVHLRIAACFGLLLFVLGGVGVWITAESRAVARDLRQARGESAVFADLARQLQMNVLQVWQWLTDISATRALDGLDDGFAKAEENYGAAAAGLARFDDMFRREGRREEMERVQRLRSELTAYYDLGKRMAEAYVRGGPQEGNALMGEFDKAADALYGDLAPFVADQRKELLAVLDAGEATSVRLERGALAAFGVSLLAVAVLGAALTRSIREPLKECATFVSTVATGDLTAFVAVRRSDEFGRLQETMNVMEGKLRRIVGQVLGASAELSAVAEELTATTEQMAASNAEVSAQAQAVAASSEEMSTAVGQVARNTDTVRLSATEASQAAAEGAEVVLGTVEALGEVSGVVKQTAGRLQGLDADSQRIGTVVEVIEDVANQTNLLALNAAIEAARAG